jgi:L-lactate dehydrogenase
MKVSVIGGGGRVGADAAYALQFGGVYSDIALIDVNQELATGEALDLLHGSAYTSNQIITSGGYEEIADTDVILITAGLRRKPDESRLNLINRNVSLFKTILDEVKGGKPKADAKIVVVSNPVDILTQLAIDADIVPAKQVIGLGTLLDTSRFRSLLAQELKVGARDVNALILGEHGDSMVPVWSSASLNGVSLETIDGFDQAKADEVFARTKKSGAEVIQRKGGAGRAVGVSIKELVESICLNDRKVLPVSTLQDGKAGISGVALSLPTVLGPEGVVQVMEPKVNDKEREGLLNSAKSLKEVYDQVK